MWAARTSGIDDGATCILDLGYGEHMLVWALRRMVAGNDCCPLLRREFADACGEDAATALAAFRDFLWRLACSGRRRLTIGLPGLLALSRDERLLLATFAAAQAGDSERLRAHLRWLAGRGDVVGLEGLAAVVAAALARRGHILPLPDRDAAIEPARLRPAVPVIAFG